MPVPSPFAPKREKRKITTQGDVTVFSCVLTDAHYTRIAADPARLTPTSACVVGHCQ